MPENERSNAVIDLTAGMDEIYGRIRGSAPVPDDYPAAGPVDSEPSAQGATGDGGAGLDIMARLAIAIEGLNRRAAEPPRPGYAKPAIPFDAAHWVPIPAVQNNAAGTIDIPNQQRPMQGYAWHLRRFTCVFGAGTTSVTIYKEAADPTTEIVQFTASGIFEPSMEILYDTHRLVYVSAGGGFTVNGGAIQVKLPWLATYLM